MHNFELRIRRACLVLVATLAACGGGESAPTPPTALTLGGTAATGAAIANKTVDVKCASGIGTGTTGANGSFSIVISGGALPCMLRVTAASGAVLHSIVTGAGSSATANITPLTQLVVASLTGVDPAAFFSTFNGTVAAAVATANLTAAKSAVIATLKAAGIDLSAAGDVVSGALTPGTSTSAGNAYDVALDALASELTLTGTTLEALTTAVAAGSTTNPLVLPAVSNTVSLPADILLRPAASNCAALRSGTYSAVFAKSNATLAQQSGKMTIDATTLDVVYVDGRSGHWTPNGECRYTEFGINEIFVSQAGVVLMGSYTGSALRLVIGFPEQTHALAELAGTWNFLGMERNSANSAYTGVAGNVTLNTAGKVSPLTFCKNDATWSVSGSDCLTSTAGEGAAFEVNGDGGFDVYDAGGTYGRAFAYRPGNGDLMMIQVGDDGGFRQLVKRRPAVMPAVGDLRSGWTISFDNHLDFVHGSVLVSANTIMSVDSTAKSYVHKANTGAPTAHLQTIAIDNPRQGFIFRAPATAVAENSVTVNVAEFTAFDGMGTGLGCGVSPANKTFDCSIRRP